MADRIQFQLAKYDDTLGLVFGYAIVCTEGGEPYYDLQDHHIPEDVMLKAATDFVEHYGIAGEMHKSAEERGTVPFVFPLTKDVASALGIQTEKTGMLVALKPDDAMRAKFKSGELTGFSVGGDINETEDADA